MGNRLGKWQDQLKETSSDTTHTIYAPIVPDGEVWRCQRLAVRNSTTAAADVLVSIEKGGVKTYLYYFSNITVNEWSSVALETLVFPTDRLCFDFSGVVNAELVEVHITGTKKFES